MGLDELTGVQSHLLGRIMAIECAVNTLITTSPHAAEIAASIRDDLRHAQELGLFEPCRDDLLDGIQSGQSALLRGV